MTSTIFGTEEITKIKAPDHIIAGEEDYRGFCGKGAAVD